MKFWLTVLSVAAVLGPGLVLAQPGGDLLKQGQEVYENNCSDCHRSNGEGLPVKFPALKGNTYVLGDPQAVIGTVVNGRKGSLGLMPAWKEHLDDNQIAAAISYIRNAWGNTAAVVKPEDVKKLRAAARGFFQRKSHYAFKANGVRNHTANGRRWSAIPPCSFEWGILAFSRNVTQEEVKIETDLLNTVAAFANASPASSFQ
jgi:mono/diheme cytochrome c family protein